MRYNEIWINIILNFEEILRKYVNNFQQKIDMFMFVNIPIIDRYTTIGNTSSTKSLSSMYRVSVNFL